MEYWPNPAHKRQTTEAGPPRWRPHKTPCPEMTLGDRQRLFEASVQSDPVNPGSKRYAVRRHEGRLELFEGQCGGVVDGELHFHGYPAHHPKFHPNPRPVPYLVLEEFRDRGLITEDELRRALRGKLFGGDR